MAKFRLTYLFVAFSIAVATLTILILNGVSAKIGERSLVSLSTRLAETDAKLIGEAIERMGTAEVSDGEQEITISQLLASFSSDDPLAVLLTFIGPEVLDPLSVVNLSLMTSEGSKILSLGPEILADQSERNLELSRASLTGGVRSVLDREVAYVTDTGTEVSGDIVTTFVPIEDSNGELSFVMTFSRDMSEELDAEIASTRDSMFKVALASIGGLFLVLVGFIVAVDVHIFNSNKNLVTEKLALAEAERDRLELIRMNDSKDRFISTVSHELKTPLTTVMGYTEVLRRNRSGNLEEKQLAHLETMRMAGWRLDILINDMLDISRIESGHLSLDKERFSINEFLCEMRSSLQPVIDERRQRLEITYDGTDAFLTADRARIFQGVTNLITNASKYSPVNSVIRVKGEIKGSEFSISVADNGIGISEEDQAQLFEMFFRANNDDTRRQPGLGLGLFITSAIVSSHGGSLGVESEPDKGTTVTLTLPDVQTEARENTSAMQTRPTESRLSSLKTA